MFYNDGVVPLCRSCHIFEGSDLDCFEACHNLGTLHLDKILLAWQTFSWLFLPGLDDQKMFAQVINLAQEFIFRVSHLERIVDVYNERLDRWESEKLEDLVDSVPYQATFQVLFKHAGKNRLSTVHFGCLRIRIPSTETPLWVLVADDETLDRQLVLLTNKPLISVSILQEVYNDWRLRTRLNTVIVLSRNKDWMLKICVFKPLNECAAYSLSYS